MKTFIPSIVNPSKPLAPALFWTLAFLPALFHLAWRNFPVTNPLVALGPVAAGFWLAASLREIRLSIALLGAAFTALLWAINWLMLAGHTCCATPN